MTSPNQEDLMPATLSRQNLLLGASTATLAASAPLFLAPKAQAAPHEQLVRDFLRVLSPAQRDAIFLP